MKKFIILTLGLLTLISCSSLESKKARTWEYQTEQTKNEVERRDIIFESRFR